MMRLVSVHVTDGKWMNTFSWDENRLKDPLG